MQIRLAGLCQTSMRFRPELVGDDPQMLHGDAFPLRLRSACTGPTARLVAFRGLAPEQFADVQTPVEDHPDRAGRPSFGRARGARAPSLFKALAIRQKPLPSA